MVFMVEGVALICVLPLSTASASSAFVFISSSRSLLVQNHISSGVVFSMYFVPFWISCVVFALLIRAVARPIRYAVSYAVWLFSSRSMYVVLPRFLVGLFCAAFSSTWRIARSPPPSALPMVNAGLRFSSSMCGYL